MLRPKQRPSMVDVFVSTIKACLSCSDIFFFVQVGPWITLSGLCRLLQRLPQRRQRRRGRPRRWSRTWSVGSSGPTVQMFVDGLDQM